MRDRLQWPSSFLLFDLRFGWPSLFLLCSLRFTWSSSFLLDGLGLWWPSSFLLFGLRLGWPPLLLLNGLCLSWPSWFFANDLCIWQSLKLFLILLDFIFHIWKVLDGLPSRLIGWVAFPFDQVLDLSFGTEALSNNALYDVSFIHLINKYRWMSQWINDKALRRW